MSKALIEILGDAASYLRSLRQSSDGTIKYEGDLKKLAVTAQTTAQAQVRAAVQKDARLRQEIVSYRELASSAKRGSREQVAAANLAAHAEGRLSRSLGTSAREARHLASSAGLAERNIGRATRGAMYGSGAFRGLGRSMFYASSYILGGYGIVAGLRAAFKASVDERQEMGQLSTAVKDAGLSYQRHRGEINATLASQRRLGFAQTDSIAAFAQETRATRDITNARSALSLADNISRGRHIALSMAANAVARAYGGQTGALRRLVPFIGKQASATEALQQAQRAYAGSSQRFANSEAGTQARLGVALHHTSVIIGGELAPEITRLSGKLATWLSNSKNEARVQRDVKIAVHDLATAAKILFGLLRGGVTVVRTVTHALGGTKSTIELLAVAFASVKFARMTGGLAGIAGKAGLAEGKVAGVTRALNALNGLAVVATIEIIVLETLKNKVLGLQKLKLNAEGNVPNYGLALVKRIASELATAEKHGQSPAAAIAGMYQRLGGHGAGQDTLIAEAEQYMNWQHRGGPKPAWMVKLEREAAKRNRRGAPAPRDHTGASAADQAMAANRLALASAKTDAQKLAALTQERALLAQQMERIRVQLRHASGSQRTLLLDELTKLTGQDTKAFDAIARIHRHEQALAVAASRKAAAAARAARRVYLDGLRTTATNLLAAAESSKTVGQVRKTYRALIEFYKREAHDTRLTALERARYAKLAIDEQTKMGRQIAADRKKAAKALEQKQLASLGVGPGQSISELLQRVKDAATAKQEGVPGVGIGPPGISALKAEADQVGKALKGTYLDTNVSRNVLARIKTLLSGQLGSLNAEMRNKIQQLLQGLRNDMKSFDGFNLAAADKRRRFLDRRFADRYGTGVADDRRTTIPRIRGGGMGRMTQRAVSPQVIHYHFEPQLKVIANEPIGHALDRAFFRQRVAMGR